MTDEKPVVINLKVINRLREEFRVAAKLEGMDMSTMLRNFMIRSVREAKERDPDAFEKPPPKSGTGGLHRPAPGKSRAAGKS